MGDENVSFLNWQLFRSDLMSLSVYEGASFTRLHAFDGLQIYVTPLISPESGNNLLEIK